METNDTKNLRCELNADMVTYLYAEATPAERERFEKHLLECTPCTDEFAELSDARFSVFEWQREEFAPLVTPKFDIPYPVIQKAVVRTGFRSIFGLGWPAFAMAAALVVTLFGFGLWIIQPKPGSGDQISKKEPVKSASVMSESPLVATENPEKAGTLNDLHRKDVAVTATNIKAEAPKKAAVHFSRPVLARVTNLRKLETEATVAELQRQGGRLPRLTARTDEEDESLRLTDLFDSLDDKQ
ncbi:MAG: zf-HC2 domain-containing protein [Acidobacteriota bacterium]